MSKGYYAINPTHKKEGFLLRDPTKWETRFLELAKTVAKWSKDPSTKCGAVITKGKNKVIGIGYNGFARGMSDDTDLYNDRDEKLSRVIHAEMNAIFNSATDLTGCTMFTTIPPCERCAVHVITTGIKLWVMGSPTPEQEKRWNFSKSYQFLREAGVDIIKV